MRIPKGIAKTVIFEVGLEWWKRGELETSMSKGSEKNCVVQFGSEILRQ